MNLFYFCFIIYLLIGLFYINTIFPKGHQIDVIRRVMEQELNEITKNEKLKDKLFTIVMWIAFVLMVLIWPKYWMNSNNGDFG